MKRFIQTLKNIFSIEELRSRILYTLLLIAVYRLGSYIVLPGVDSRKLDFEAQGLLGLLDTLVGGAFSKASIMALGIMPYISASIAIQLLGLATTVSLFTTWQAMPTVPLIFRPCGPRTWLQLEWGLAPLGMAGKAMWCICSTIKSR